MNDAPLANTRSAVNAGGMRSPISCQIKVHGSDSPGAPGNRSGSQTVKEQLK
jgi:hypothetical protein